MNTTGKRKEKRNSTRVSLLCHMSYLRIPKKVEGYSNAAVQNISPGGFRFRTNEPFPRRSCFLLDVYLPGSNPIRSLATVAWIKAIPGDDGYLVGGKFVEPNLEVGTVLAHLVPKP